MGEFGYASLVSAVNRLRAQAPFFHARVIGRSLCGRGLFALRFGGSGGALIAAGLDAGDGEAGAALLGWAEGVCRCAAEGTPFCGVDLSRALSFSGVTVLPWLNPDGLEIVRSGAKGAGTLRQFTQSLLREETPWRAGAAGLRLDRQFPCGFEEVRERQLFSGADAPAADGFFGTTPFSSPETAALARFCRSERFSRLLMLGVGEGLLSFFPAGEAPAERETVLGLKMLAASAGVPFVLPAAAERAGTFPAWFAETLNADAFALTLEHGGFDRRLEDALTLFAVM